MTKRCALPARAFAHLACLGLLCIISSCAMNTGDDADVVAFGERTETLISPHIVTGATGVVEFFSPREGPCTGTMISPYVIATAGHCLDEIGAGTSGTESSVSVYYYDPDGGRRKVYGGTVSWFRWPTFGQGDGGAAEANSDFGLLIARTPFTDTDYHDYVRIYSDISDPIENGTLRMYGAGTTLTPNGIDDDNYLRRADLSVENVEDDHVTVDTSRDAGVCGGDSGGPLIAFTTMRGKSYPLLVGVLSNGDTESELDLCSDGGDWATHDNAHFSRVNGQKLEWIREQTGHECKVTGTSNLQYRRCFDVPFIHDIAGEGVPLGAAATIATL